MRRLRRYIPFQSVGEVGNNSFKVNFTPTDTVNYNTVENVDVVVVVSAPEPEPEETANKHGFCLGLIVLILAVLELVA